MDGLTERPLVFDDAPQLTELMNALDVASGAEAGWTVADVRSWLEPLLIDPERNSRLLFAPDGQLAAAAYVIAPPADGVRAEINGGVHPDWRGRGIGRDLVDWSLDRLHALYDEQASQANWLVEAFTVHDKDAGERLFAHYGFKPERFFFDMKAPLDPASPRDVPQVPDRLRVGTIPDGHEQILYEVNNEAFTDHWGFEPQPYEQWRAIIFNPDTCRPDLSRLVFDGDEIAAFVICFNGIEGEVYFGDVGTRRPWRKRGLASLLLATCLRAAEQSGLTRARLHVDSDSLTGAVGVYQRVGFAVDTTNCCYTRPLNP